MVKKLKVFSYIVIFLLVSTYFFNEYRTKNLVHTIFDTAHLSGEIKRIFIMDEEELSFSSMALIGNNNPIFFNLTHALDNLKIKRLFDADFSYTNGYSLNIIYNNKSYHLYINDNGILKFERKYFKLQDKESIETLLVLLNQSVH